MATNRHVLRKSYVYADGSTSRSAKKDWTGIRFEFLAPEKVEDKIIVLETVTYARDQFASVWDCAAGHGLMQKMGDELAGIDKKAAADGESFHKTRGWADYAQVLIGGVFDNLTNGVWVEEGEGSGASGNVTILAEAIIRFMAENGVETDEIGKVHLLQNLQDKAVREGAKRNPMVAKHIADIAAERARARALKMAAEATAAGGQADAAAGLAGLFTAKAAPVADESEPEETEEPTDETEPGTDE